jgi:hypothetical protein
VAGLHRGHLEGRKELNLNRPAKFSPISVNSAASVATMLETAAEAPSELPLAARKAAPGAQGRERGITPAL